MPKTYWTKPNIELLQQYLQTGAYTLYEIASKMGKSYDSVRNAIRRYNLQKYLVQEEKDVLFVDEQKGKKIKKQEVDELAKLVGAKIYDSYKKVKLIEPKVKRHKGKREEISILDLSDVHVGMINEVYDDDLGKRILTYNNTIFRQEMDNLQQSIFEIHDILSNSYCLKKLVINFLGDIITNDRIFPEQVFEIEECVGNQIFNAVPIFANFLNNLLKIYQTIEVVCVVGNHGRSNPNHYNEPVENNFEYFFYKILEKQFENSKRIKIIVPNTRRYIHKIGKWKHLVEHGDQLRGYTDTSIEKQLKEIYVNIGGFDVMHFGHLHKLKEREISDKVIVKQNGCWIFRDNYAWNKFKTFSIPKQHFFGCNNKRPETWSYKIDLRG
jgi:hypothetical protein